ncbi:hypothetical protein [Cohnella abietis]|uniref:Uncharacterized protein n=1 Tax=Cohnella abietis TaxID=2507935 RepID=A0A3T1D040_9BACL|nr:hypothetical protein [Cohnella abietis]BBI31379.1 hypothetical protein KCTCHS21_07780 [Cohnella abietis]
MSTKGRNNRKRTTPWEQMLENFEQRVFGEARLELDVRYFRATGV